MADQCCAGKSGKTALNDPRWRRVLWIALIVNAAAGTLMWLVAWGDGLTLLTALRCYLVINAVTWAIPGVIDEPRALWVSGAVSLALGASYLVPSLTILFGGLFGGIGLLILGALLARVSSTAR